MILPSGLTEIEGYTFYGCSGLTGEMNLPSSLTSIGWYAFYGCSGLTGDLTLPSGLTSIGDRAFEGCSGLTGDLVLPSGLTSIRMGVFEDCSGLTGDLVIPKSITSWKIWAFDGCSFQNVTIGASEIPSYAFGKNLPSDKGCKFTGKLTLEETVTSIGQYAFEGCGGLTGDLIIPKSVTSWGGYAFVGCSFQNVTIGASEIPDYAFGKDSYGKRCEFNGKLTLEETVTSIGSYAFSDCSGLTGELVLPSGLTEIGNSAFYRCSGLTGEMNLPSGLTFIGERAFYGCSGLTGNLVLPSGLTEIEDWAFYGCSGLTGDINLPSGLTSIGEYAFFGCSSLTGDLTIPKSVTSWGKQAFEGCSFQNVTIGASEIPDYAFGKRYFPDEGCKITGKLTLEETVTSIGNWAFWDCSGIEDVVIPKSVTSIGTQAFVQCNIYGYKGSEAENYVKRSENTWYACTFIPLDSSQPDTPVKVTYEIRFNGNGSTGGSTAKLTGCEVGKSYTLPANGFTRTGYAFAGWNTKKDGSGKSFQNKATVKDLTKKDGATVTLYAQWKSNRYSIAFNGNGATEGEMKTLANRQVGTDYTLPANKFKKKGYAFAGWNTKKDGSGKSYKNKATVKDLTKKNGATVTLYAQWEKVVSYQIKFNGNGATSGKMSALKCKTGKSYQLPANAFKKQGYTFAGWNTKKDGKGKSFKNKASVKDLTKKSGATVTLYAQWKPNTYTIRFDGNKATSGKMKDMENCQYGKSFKLTKSAYKRKGYTFAGWNTKKNGTGKSYKNGAQVKNLTAKNKGTVVLYAQWIKKK